MNNYITVIIILSILLLGILFFIPPFHWVIVALFSLLAASLCGLIAQVVSKKRKLGIITGILVFLILTLQILHVLTPLNVLITVLLGASLLAL